MVDAAGSARAPLATQRGGAKSLLLTLLGEFVLPAGGSVWTSTLVSASDALGIGEKNARQAIARIGDRGLITGIRHGRSVRWSLTDEGRRLLEAGTRRIYGFGESAGEWDGVWLLAHCAVAESQRPLRQLLRTRLAFLGFGELSPSLLISPHPEREDDLRRVLDELNLRSDSVVLRSTTASIDEACDVVAKAWDIGELEREYVAFADAHGRRDVTDDRDAFVAVIELVHGWRRFPFADPELPTCLLPQPWSGADAAAVFGRCHQRWSSRARRWFFEMETETPPA